MWRRVHFWSACSRASRGETRNTSPRPRAARQPDQTPAAAGRSHTLPTPADFRSRTLSRFQQRTTQRAVRLPGGTPWIVGGHHRCMLKHRANPLGLYHLKDAETVVVEPETQAGKTIV